MAKKPMSAKAVEATTKAVEAPTPPPAEEPAVTEGEQPPIEPIAPVIPNASDSVETVAVEPTPAPEVLPADDTPAPIVAAEPPPAKKPAPLAAPYGIIDLVKGRELAGWLRISGDPAAVRVFLLRDFRELEIPIVPSGSAENIWLFSLSLPVALTARELLVGQAAVVARCDGQEHKLGLWDPIRVAGEIGGYDLTMLGRLRYALPRGILGSLTRDPSLDDR